LPRLNNFDLIRLLAALQVFVMHAFTTLGLSMAPIVAEVMDWFPGVPIFFMISGMLIVNSFIRLPTLVQFFQHRALRIFPGLWVCLAISLLLAGWQGDLPSGKSLFLQTAVWAAMQGTFFQFVNFWINPGVTNGVLWSIATELQFYIALPIVVAFGSRFLQGRVRISAMLIASALISAALHQWIASHQEQLLPRLYPTLYASLLANGYLFAIGALAYLWHDKLLPLCRNRFLFFVSVYLALRTLFAVTGTGADAVHTSMWGLLLYPLLGLVIYSLAFSFEGLSHRTLRGNDLSYGIYIYHMPVMYASLHIGWTGMQGLAVVTAGVALLAIGSWYFIERPALGLKQETRFSASEACALGTPR